MSESKKAGRLKPCFRQKAIVADCNYHHIREKGYKQMIGVETHRMLTIRNKLLLALLDGTKHYPYSDMREYPPLPTNQGYVYAFKSDGIYKVGWSQSPKKRMATHQGNMLNGILILDVVPTFDPLAHESFLKAKYAKHIHKGREWFKFPNSNLEYQLACDLQTIREKWAIQVVGYDVLESLVEAA